MRVWIVLAALAACGDNDAEVTYRDGARLVNEWLVADDGTRVPQSSIHDLVRDDTCFMQPWTDGVTRCTSEHGFVAYSDPACSQRIVIDSAAAPNDISLEYGPSSCGPTGAFEIGALTTVTAWYFPTSTSCKGPYTTTDPIYAIGAPVDPGVFAKIDLVDADGGRLHARYFQSADGLRVPASVYDHELATTCYPQDGACQPSTTSSAYYSDSLCQRMVIPTYDSPCAQDTVYYDQQDATCPDQHHYYTVGTVVVPDKIYSLDTSTRACTETMPSEGTHFHAVGDEVTAAEMTRAQALPAGKRLQPIYHRGDGVAVRDGTLYDSQLQIECAFQLAIDGVPRCLPFGAGWTSAFTDARCMLPIMVTSVPHPDSRCGAPGPAPQFATASTASGWAVRFVVGRYDGVLHTNVNGACGVLTYPGRDVYAVGDLVLAASFVGATTQIGRPRGSRRC